MFEITVTPDFLLIIFAALLAVVFDWFPGLSPWYAGLSELKKKQVMIGLLLVVAAVVYGGTCYGVFASNVACSRIGISSLVTTVLIAAGVNQGVHLLTKPAAKK